MGSDSCSDAELLEVLQAWSEQNYPGWQLIEAEMTTVDAAGKPGPTIKLPIPPGGLPPAPGPDRVDSQ